MESQRLPAMPRWNNFTSYSPWAMSNLMREDHWDNGMHDDGIVKKQHTHTQTWMGKWVNNGRLTAMKDFTWEFS